MDIFLAAPGSWSSQWQALVISQVQGTAQTGNIIFRIGSHIWNCNDHFWFSTKSLLLAWLALAVTGAADGVSTIIRNTIRQLQTPDHIRGRMTSVNQIFFQGGPQLGEVEAGTVAQFLARRLPLSAEELVVSWDGPDRLEMAAIDRNTTAMSRCLQARQQINYTLAKKSI